MFALFRALTDRVKALFITTAALDFEADFLTRQAERKANLLRQAAQYEDEGLPLIARDLRQQAETLSGQRPLASVLPSIEHLEADRPNDLLQLPNLPKQNAPVETEQPQPRSFTPQKKRRKS